jgi:uncharacterized protein
MQYLLLLLLLLFLLLGPQLWTAFLLRRYGRERPDLRGNGAELARHLVTRFGLDGVVVEQTPHGDHYDPDARAVRLSESNFHGRSLTALAVAAHEVGHAIQHHHREPLFFWRDRLVRLAVRVERVGGYLLLAAPLVGLLSRHPAPALVSIGIGLVSLGASAVVHFITLPVELDASFNKALPILVKGGYVPHQDEAAVRRVLRAAAYTYVAASLMSLLNVWRWFQVLRR